MHRALRVLFVLYFATHIPITLLVDAQAVLPPAWFPGFARRLVDYHVRTFHDPLMRAPQPGWFRALVACELGLQLPFFFVALRALAARDDGARDAMLVYGAHVATTMVPILGALATDNSAFPSELARLTLVGIYSPYLLVPLLLVGVMMGSARPLSDAPPPVSLAEKEAPANAQGPRPQPQGRADVGDDVKQDEPR